MDFVTALSKTRNDNDTILVIVDCLTKFVVFIPIKAMCANMMLGEMPMFFASKCIQEYFRNLLC